MKMIGKEPRGQELIKRYKSNYQISDDVNISEEMILRHWELEKSLTRELLESSNDNRWETFDRCYTQLYSELDWINKYTGSSSKVKTPQEKYGIWAILIGRPQKRVYEIGSGKGELISYLASHNYFCRGTEITRERGEKHVSKYSNLSWGKSDGIHLNQFEKMNTYDVVISNQVIEHMHPNDIVEHFTNVRTILMENGRYIFTTPNKYFGPEDISSVFKCDKPMGMHLTEYSNQEIEELLMKSGFKKISAVLSIPEKINNLFGFPLKPMVSRLYFSYLVWIENFISIIPKQTYRRKIAFLCRFILFRPSIFISAQK